MVRASVALIEKERENMYPVYRQSGWENWALNKWMHVHGSRSSSSSSSSKRQLEKKSQSAMREETIT